MNKTLSIILALALTVSMFTGITFSATAEESNYQIVLYQNATETIGTDELTFAWENQNEDVSKIKAGDYIVIEFDAYKADAGYRPALWINEYESNATTSETSGTKHLDGGVLYMVDDNYAHYKVTYQYKTENIPQLVGINRRTEAVETVNLYTDAPDKEMPLPTSFKFKPKKGKGTKIAVQNFEVYVIGNATDNDEESDYPVVLHEETDATTSKNKHTVSWTNPADVESKIKTGDYIVIEFDVSKDNYRPFLYINNYKANASSSDAAPSGGKKYLESGRLNLPANGFVHHEVIYKYETNDIPKLVGTNINTGVYESINLYNSVPNASMPLPTSFTFDTTRDDSNITTKNFKVYVTNELPGEFTITGVSSICKGSTEKYSVTVKNDFETLTSSNFDWSIVTEGTGATIDEQGTLFVPVDATAETITIQATSKYNETVFKQYTIEVFPEGTPLYALVDFEEPASLPDVFDSANITQVDGRDGNVYKIGAGTTQTDGVSFNLVRYATNNTMAKASFDYMAETFPENASLITVRDHNESGNDMNIGSVTLSDHNAIVEEEYTDATGVFKIADMSGVITGNWYHFDVYAYPSNDKGGRGIYVEATGIFADSDEVQTKSAIVYGGEDSAQHYPKVVRVEFGTGYVAGTSPMDDNVMYLDNIGVTELKPSVDVEIKGEYELGGSVKATSLAAEISGMSLNKGNNSIPFDFVRGIDIQLTVNKNYQAIVTAEDEEEKAVDTSTTYLIKAEDTKGVAIPNYKFTVEFVPATNYEILSVDEEGNTTSAVNIKCLLATEEAAKVFVAAYDANGTCIEVVSGDITDVNVGDEAKIMLAKGLNTEAAKTVKTFILANDSLNPLAKDPCTVNKLHAVVNYDNDYQGNPYMPLWEYVPDGEPYVFEDPDNPGKYRLYVYGSHDMRKTGYCGTDQVVWSAPVEDLSDWRKDGVIFESIVGGKGDVLYAPDIVLVERDGKKEYYLYPNNQTSGRLSMVAKSDRPDGPFVPINFKQGSTTQTDGPIEFDPAVMVDDDGKVYAYWGYRDYSKWCLLDEDNMSTLKEGTEIHNNIPGHDAMLANGYNPQDYNIYQDENVQKWGFFEASSIRKVGNKYVFIYSRSGLNEEPTGRNYAQLAYGYSDSPAGPWKYGGIIVDAAGEIIPKETGGYSRTFKATNTHGSICEINGQWYIFYHRSLQKFARQAMVDPVSVEWDDRPVSEGGEVRISMAEVTSNGFYINGLNPYKKHSAGIASYLTGNAAIEPAYEETTTTLPVTGIKNGVIAGIKYFNFDLEAPSEGDRSLEVELKPLGVDATVDVYIRPTTAVNTPVEYDASGAITSVGVGSKKIGTITLTGEMPQEMTTFSINADVIEELNGQWGVFFVFNTNQSEDICEFYNMQFK